MLRLSVTEFCHSRDCGPTIRPRNLKLGTKVGLGQTIYQKSQKLEKVAMETSKYGIADFEALFGYEWLIYCQQ